ncbi:MAG TPA: TetR/AcrR family transcriptional regulator [Allosphingosinicella sp.]|jgi:AcrR family transcriptional regulator
MTDDLNSVKTRPSYHHGQLRESLLAAAEAVIAERGVDAFSLRETARRAGVSPAAPAHHFGDARGLLTALATLAFDRFGDALASAEAAAAGEGRQARMQAQGLAYVRFALEERAKFDLMWRYALIDREDTVYQAASYRGFQLLDRAVRGPDAPAPSGPGDPILAPSIACWATVHGFARLALDGAFGSDSEAPARAVKALLPAVLGHLRV